MISKTKFAILGVAALGAIAALSMAGTPSTAKADGYGTLPKVEDGQAVAIFAGGCFWCVESDFDNVPGVLATTSGYTGGTSKRPSYKQVTYKDEGHYEAVHVIYDPEKVSYKQLLTAFWHSVNPTDAGGQFCDRGPSYETAIFVTDEQRPLAEASKKALEEAKVLDKPIVTPILDTATFYPAETYHQDYYLKNPVRYSYYRNGCRRNDTVKAVWGDLAFKGIEKH